MSKPHPKCVNPCTSKGKYLGSMSGRSTYLSGGSSVRVRGCECNQAFLSIAAFNTSDPPKPRRALNLFGATIVLDNNDLLPADAFQIIPCNETFRNRDSVGTTAYKKSTNTRFDGCQAIEDWLVENGLVRPEPFENLGVTPKLITAVSSFARPIEEPYRLPTPEQLLISREEKEWFKALLRLNADVRKRAHCFDPTPSPWSPLMDLASPPPANLKDAHLKSLFQKNKWAEVDSKLQTAAYFTIRGITKRSELEVLMPHFRFEDYSKLQARLYADVEKTFPEIYKRFLKFWDGKALGGEPLSEDLKLTEKQKEILELLYMNDETHLQTEIATKLGLARSTVNEHIKKATAKMKKVFNLTPICEARPPEWWANIFKSPDSSHDGFYRRSSKIKIQGKPDKPIIFELDPITKQRIGLWTKPIPPKRNRKNYDLALIKEWDKEKRPKYRTVEPVRARVTQPK